METLIMMSFGYCIGKLYSQKISRNWYLKNQKLIDTIKTSNKALIITILSSDRFKKTLNIMEKINDESNNLENQFINEYPHLSLDERIELANNIVEIKYFDEIEKIEKDYIDKIEIVNYKIDDFFEKIKSIILTDNIDDLINFSYNEEL